MPENLLAGEASPYLLQHKDNPVAWRPWGPAALAAAKAEDKPILLSVGYAACHWCHVMAHESFEDADIAALMNTLFVNIKVDREERPDIDQIYMAALHATGEQGGWPLTMFLTPDGRPIFGGTYFPKTSRYGRPAFADVLREVARIYREEPDRAAASASAILAHISSTREHGEGVTLDAGLLRNASTRLLQFMDPVRGGTNSAPKFPQASLLDFLWHAGFGRGGAAAHEAVLVTLRHICQGGIYDHVGGGFARYSVDDRWLVPHFEKMLYDNAQLLELLTHAWLATGAPLFAARVEETVAWLVREMRLAGGTFAASLDADSDGHEGRFYVWSLDEVLATLCAGAGAAFADAYDITSVGNWEGTSIPNRLAAIGDDDEAIERFAGHRATLLARRSMRPRPATDDKVLADWNGLLIAALAFAGASFARPDWIALAQEAFGFIATTMMRGERLAHSWRQGKTVYPGLATDYAAMIRAALALHQATLDPDWIHRAEALTATCRAHHWDAAAGNWFLSADDAEALIMRPRSTTDEATPSATSLMTANLIRLWRLTGKDDYRQEADAALDGASRTIGSNLFAATGMLSALDLRLGATDVVIVRPPGGNADRLVAAARASATPNTILSLHDGSAALPSTHPAHGKEAIGGHAAAYVCHGETCSLPVTEPDALADLLRYGAR
jgi:uncharacterized protein YyaL (SSP411 family)